MKQEKAENKCATISDSFFSRLDLAFSSIPEQSRIFISYQENPLRLRRYYPLTVLSHAEIPQNALEILQSYETDREKLCDALERINLKCGASDATLSNISLLRESDCVAVVTGQQAGLFTGPLYSIYKTLTAIKLTECLKGRGIKAVPVFWVATEDHDFAEVASAFILDKTGKLKEIKNEPIGCYDRFPVGIVKLDETIKETIQNLFESLPQTSHSNDLREFIERCWTTGSYYGEAFAKMMLGLFGKYGLILLCPLDEELKRLASPIYAHAIEKSDEIISALSLRNYELEREGFHVQVPIPENYFPIFWHSEDGRRHALKKVAEGEYQIKDGERKFTRDELIRIAKESPTQLSPSVILRPIVQDYLLPTVCYFGGAAEIAYFAQAETIYRILKRPVTPILHRQSFTFVTPKQIKLLDKYKLKFEDLFQGTEKILKRVVEKQISPDTAKLFAEVEEEINIQLNRLDQALVQIDVTLAENLAKRRRKILYHIAALRNKFHRVQIQKNNTIRRQIESLFDALLPFEHLQERTLNISFFLNLYGFEFIDWIYQAIDLDNKNHQVIYLR
ncbi:MAG: putative cysteine ligase BshC [Pyrinomonadaceae bacterium]|nr:MAG: putative cysteine ligase BshC [Pyrinomonadaceae bacterium]